MAKTAAKRSTDSARKRKAHGRSLADFEPLLPAEKKLLEACRMGEIAEVGTGKRPDKMTEDNRVRPGFIRFLALGGDDQAPVYEKGVEIAGGWVDGTLDLQACRAVAPLWIRACSIEGDVIVRDASLSALSLEATSLNSLHGDRLTASGSVHLRNSFSATGEVRLLGAKIGGSLSCSRGAFEPKEGYALSCDGADITGDLFLDDGFHARGAVRLLGAKIGGQLACKGGKFEPREGDALSCDGADIAGDVFLDDGFRATGEVTLRGARIGGNLSCEGGQFEPTEGNALTCDGVETRGGLFFRNVSKITGYVSFAAAAVDALSDDHESWALAPHLILDGFRYGRIVAGPTDAATRIAWLKMQTVEHLGEEFKPQPWEHLIKVLRDMGHEVDARAVAIEKQRMLRAAGKINGFLKPLHWTFGLLAGYGHKPLNTVCAMFLVWILASGVFVYAEQHGIMAPTSPAIQINAEMRTSCGGASGIRFTAWTECKDLPKEYTGFNALLYSLDLVLPLVDLQQDKDWAPIVTQDDGVTSIWLGVFTRFVMWFEILFGWGTSLLLVAVAGNLVKKD